MTRYEADGILERIVHDICREAGVNERNYLAFVRFALDGFDGREVVREIRSLRNTNNLYQIRNRIRKLLGSRRERFAELYRELQAA